jgi:hypothetical protein
MSSPATAVETQLNHIQTKTGKSLDELTALIYKSRLTKHSEIRSLLIQELGLGYGDANTLVHYAFQSDGERAAQAKGLSNDDVLDEIYSGAKAQQRPIHEKLIMVVQEFGPFEVIPKKGYVSLRRKRQFAMLGPATNTRFELGLNMKGIEPTERLNAMPSGSMCNYKVKLTDPAEVDNEIINWIKLAYDSAG